ncbi:hypothetical protein AYI69_g5278 [Smittium culicis]|uniref:Endonuclease/exonuclease/phosphatase domain-containing protein n=1 Tax=Smittium culicis TaxID=133412 RepID=A0A1R1Y769_9FUNG|nr:hypothetical protein AYI69_g5278 [Smittium culicis]
MYEEIREGGRSELARATKTLKEDTSSARNHQVIGSYVEMLGRKWKRGTEVDEGARHKLPKHGVFVVIRSLVHHLPRKSTDSNTKHAVEASDNEDEGRANRKKANPFVFIEHDVEFIKKRKLDLFLWDDRRVVGGRSNSQIRLESVKDAIVKPLRVAGLTRVFVPYSLVGEMRAPIGSPKDKGIYLIKYSRMRKVNSGLSDRLVSLNIRCFRGQRLEYFEMLRRLRPKVVMVQESLVKRNDWAVTIPGYDFFHYYARKGSNHGVLLGISKSHVAQRILGIEGKLVVVQAQLDEQTIKFCLFYLPCNSTTERASTKRKLLELLQTWSFEYLEEPCIISGDFNMSNSALGLLLKRNNTGYSVVDLTGCSKSFFGNGEKN